jgi:hypothetical protein
MRLAVELPVQAFPLSDMLDFDFIIASHCLTNPSYRSFYSTPVAPHRMRMLDNGAFELGRAIDAKEYDSLIQDIRPTVVVLPDIVNDMQATETAVLQFLSTASETLPYELMGVLQGKTVEEYMRMLDFYAQFSDISYIGIPYHLFYRPKFIRDNKVDEFCDKNNLSIHILGLPNPFEAVDLSKIPCVETLDSSLPAVSGIYQRRFRDLQWRSARLNIGESLIDEQLTAIHDNIVTLNQLCNWGDNPFNVPKLI